MKTTIRPNICVVAALLLASLGGHAFADGEAKRVIYSSICTEAQSGDVAGYQVVLDTSASPPSVSFDWSEGPLMEPVRAVTATFDRRTRALHFKADANGSAVSFSGRASPRQLSGTLTWIRNPADPPSRERVRLKHVTSLNSHPAC